MSVAHVNGTELFYEETGSGEPLVIVHGSWLDHQEWMPVAWQLADSFRVIAYDRRGHSNSEPSCDQGSFAEDADDLAALIEDVAGAPAHVVGHSSGAIIALTLAAARPELLRTLILHEPPLFDLLADDPEARPLLQRVGLALATVREKLENDQHEAAARQFADDVAFGAGAWERQLSTADRERMIRNAPTFLDELRQPARLRLDLQRLADLKAPVLLTEGSASAPLRAMTSTKLVQALRHIERRVLDGAAHMPHLTDPDGFTALIRQFATTGSPSHTRPTEA